MRDLGVVGDDPPAVTKTPEELGWVEAEPRRDPERPGRSPIEARAERLRRVLDDQQVVLARDGRQGIHVAGAAVELNGHERTRPLGHQGGNMLRIDHVIVPHVRQDGNRTGVMHRAGGGHERVRGKDHLVPGLDSRGPQGDQQRIRAVPHPKGVPDIEESSQVCLEALQLGLQDVSSPRENAFDRGEELGLLLAEKRGVVEEGDALGQAVAPT